MAEAFDGEDGILAAWRSGLAPDPLQTVSEWADTNRYLSSRGASEAGLYRTARTPYLRDIMDALSVTNPARRIVFMKAAQVGATEAGNNWIGYVIHRVPGPFLAVQPTTDMAKRLSQQRIDPLIEDSPALRERVAPSRARDSGNTMLSKRFSGGQFVITGANSAVGLRSMPARYVFLDEVDAYPGDVDGEGDPIALAEARIISFGHRAKMFLASTPTVKGLSRIEREYEASDQRRYFVPCPHCGGMQWLQFERLRWEKGQPHTVAYVCEHCEERIEERHKTWFMDPSNGAEWRPTASPEQIAAARAAGTVGFHISGLYSPLGWLSWEKIARTWEGAQASDDSLKTVKNTVLGETWAERGEAPDWQRIYERRGPHRLGTVPGGAVILTAGADVQRDRVEIDIWGWGRNMRSWLVDHIVIEGDIGTAAVLEKLDGVLSMTWPHENGGRLGIERLAIDTGDNTDAVYAWVRRHMRDKVLAIKGARDAAASSPVNGPSWVEVTSGGRKIKRGVQLWNVKVSFFKSETYRYLRLAAPTDEDLEAGADWPQGYMHIPAGITSEWVEQLTAEQLMTVKTRQGYTRAEWHKTRPRNEALDCRVYARAAAWLLGIDRWPEARWERLESEFMSRAEREAREAAASMEDQTRAATPRVRAVASNDGEWIAARGDWL